MICGNRSRARVSDGSMKKASVKVFGGVSLVGVDVNVVIETDLQAGPFGHLDGIDDLRNVLVRLVNLRIVGRLLPGCGPCVAVKFNTQVSGQQFDMSRVRFVL